MSILQVWLVVGVPALILACALFYGRSRLRTALGYVVLLVAFGLMLTVDPASATVVGGIVALLYATGRGGTVEGEVYDSSTLAVPESTRRPARQRPDTG